ncbi:hypothetical protein [Flavobacterium sp. CSZ]|uniref:hypothetical protein n=1 Tax=Flavobacterium sp. CSZ TaxID=2783791 RepID=UPI00188DBF52|nr:hypothetical protein [Flavobacterium sp. CSZ]MBF4485862.1 hypothetical protein [Flavobacterium sp. CSZ]
MIQQVKRSKFKKTIAIYLAMMILLETFQPMQIYALTGGPSQPEFESFTPIGTSDMVDLSSGDFNYNIPIMDVGGYPLNLAYNSGVGMDQEASWVGLGWDLNVGQISRQLRGLPDDFNGDEMIYENSMKPNVTVGSSANVFLAAVGLKEAKINAGIGIKYNNYDGFGVAVNGGFSYQISQNLSVGTNISSSASEGVTVSPSISLSQRIGTETDNGTPGVNAGVSYNNRRGVESMTLGATFTTKSNQDKSKEDKTKVQTNSSNGVSGSVSFNNASFTPTKRIGMVSSNFMFSTNIEGEVWSIEPGFKFSGYRTSQGIKNSEKYKVEKAYGFENTYSAPRSAVLDFNREKDRTFSKNTTSLPITNNTYDIYSIQGQGISGMYRPYKSQVGYVYDNETNDDSAGGSLGLEFGGGGGVHFGVDVSVTIGDSYSALWSNSNPALGRFKEKKNNTPDYEKVFFKNIGGFHTDKELDLFEKQLGSYDPILLGIEGNGFDKKTNLNYSTNKGAIANTNQVARKTRLARNQSIDKLTKAEAENFGFSKQFSEFAKDNHTAEIKITKEGGDRYVYGLAAYNSLKKEVTFDVSDKDQYREVKAKRGLIEYSPGVDNSARNSKGGDQYFNRVTTPAYAHTYLLTSVLSSDYQDISANGPSDDDLGTYTNFEYENKSVDREHNYRWRIPFEKNLANFDEGLRSSKKDNKANYLYGEKELLYIKKIVTKTHIAIFHLSARNDGYGVKDENGGIDETTPVYKLDKISLYSKPEYLAKGDSATPIKEAHFKYSYSLCQGIDNNKNKGKAEFKGQQGKLTLDKVYFTYKKSKMGEYTPYVFNYASEFDASKPGYNLSNDENNNPNYDMKAYDVWGNYKKINEKTGVGTMDALSNAEYPFVDQKEKVTTNNNASVWLLKSIHLPSGGIMELNYESDDYSKVQNKDVMQMFKVVGSGSKSDFTAANINDSNIPDKKDLGDYIYVELDHKIVENASNGNSDIASTFFSKYLKTIGDEDNPLYFRFLLNMVNPDPKPGISQTDKYDYVTGYMRLSKKIDDYAFNEFNGKQYVAIPLEKVRKEDGLNGKKEVNPISKTGWGFGRKNLNRLVYSMDNEEDTSNLKGLVTELVGWLPALLKIFTSPNKQLQENGIASNFITGKSWVRLSHPDNKKLGGGSRVKKIMIYDQWDVMTGHPGSDTYKQFYGQEYSYNAVDKDGNPLDKSSGVATYEPLGSKENPFVKPFYDKNNPELLLGPDTDNYVEEPFGESFFPSPKVTYSRVEVSNLARENTKDPSYGSVVKKHATGKVVTEFYTSNDFPTIVDRTVLSGGHKSSGVLANLINLNVKDYITLSQGYSIHTNDMDGKMKNQRVYGEGQKKAISGVDYNYSTTGANPETKNYGLLNNTVKTVDSKGVIGSKLVGVDYDVINDFRENKSVTSTNGVAVNVATLPFTIVVVVIPTIVPSRSKHETLMRTAVTTKVVHTSAILAEKVAYDLGSIVSTKNLAWDADTGDVLLTETVNEYNDKYFNFNFPAYWSYDGMSQAAMNAGLEWKVLKTGNDQYQFEGDHKESDYLIDGDEVWLSGTTPGLDGEDKINALKGWVVEVNASSFQLLDSKGLLIKGSTVNAGKIKIIRSGHRNMQMASMASITSMRNPLYNYDGNNKITGIKGDIGKAPFSSQTANDRIVNASAIEYNNQWPSQCECNLPKMTFVNGELAFGYETQSISEDLDAVAKRSYNPYLYNVLGNWRANKSYAYLTGRNYTIDPTPRKTGYFTDFSPFYVFSDKWNITTGEEFKKWTFASEVTQYSPYGQEVENRDALYRYSSALYGYNNRFPVAVASNTKYSELASDGFEDYDLSNCGAASHFDFQDQLKLNEVSVSTKQSHTGRKSLKIEANQKAVVKKQIVPCKPKASTVNLKTN